MRQYGARRLIDVLHRMDLLKEKSEEHDRNLQQSIGWDIASPTGTSRAILWIRSCRSELRDMKDGNVCLIRISRPVFPYFSGFRLHLLAFINLRAYNLPKPMAPLAPFCGQETRWSLTWIAIKFPLTGLALDASSIRTQFACRDTGVRPKHCHHCILLDDCSHGQSNIDMTQSSKLSGLPAVSFLLATKITMACLND